MPRKRKPKLTLKQRVEVLPDWLLILSIFPGAALETIMLRYGAKNISTLQEAFIGLVSIPIAMGISALMAIGIAKMLMTRQKIMGFTTISQHKRESILKEERNNTKTAEIKKPEPPRHTTILQSAKKSHPVDDANHSKQRHKNGNSRDSQLISSTPDVPRPVRGIQ